MLEEQKLICKSNIDYIVTKKTKILIFLWYVIVTCLYCVYYNKILLDMCGEEFNIDKVVRGSGTYWSKNYWLWECLYFIVLATPPMIIVSIKKYISSHCDLQLDSDGISGNRKKLFSNKNLKLPMEQIDSITMSENVFSRWAGTKTLEIRSGTGIVRFPWVHNADEFVEATLNEIKKFKETVNKNTVPTYAAPPTPAPKKSESDSAIEQLEKLKKLYDQGVLTAEEFEAKKKALLDKI